MGTWHIVAIIALIGVAFWLLFSFQKSKIAAAAAKSKSKGIGEQIVSGAEQIPVYGTALKAAAPVVKTVNKALNTVNVDITKGLQHIPVVGNVLAMPNQIAGAAVKKVTSFFGF